MWWCILSESTGCFLLYSIEMTHIKQKSGFCAYIAILSLNLIWLKFYWLFLDAIPKNLPIILILFSYHYTYDYITPINLFFMLYCWHPEEHGLDVYYANVVAICANISDAYSKKINKMKCANTHAYDQWKSSSPFLK